MVARYNVLIVLEIGMSNRIEIIKYGMALLLVLGCTACGGPEPRRPVAVKSGSFFKTSVERSKKLLAQEEALFQGIIEKDTVNDYKQTATGSWFRMDVANPEAAYTPKPDDLVTMTYNVMDLSGDTLYSQEDIGILNYKVDKQELFPGLRNSVKLLKEGETATFLFPSSLAYGYHGDEDKIGINVPIMSTISILKIEKNEDSVP